MTLNMGDNNYNEFNDSINKCNNIYMLLYTVISNVIYN